MASRASGRVGPRALLEHGDRAEREAVVSVLLGHFREGFEGFGLLTELEVKVPDLVHGVHVAWIVLHDLHELLDRVAVLALRDKLVGLLEGLFAIERHRTFSRRCRDTNPGRRRLPWRRLLRLAEDDGPPGRAGRAGAVFSSLAR